MIQEVTIWIQILIVWALWYGMFILFLLPIWTLRQIICELNGLISKISKHTQFRRITKSSIILLGFFHFQYIFSNFHSNNILRLLFLWWLILLLFNIHQNTTIFLYHFLLWTVHLLAFTFLDVWRCLYLFSCIF